MACYYPISAYQCTDGQVVFNKLAKYNIDRELQIPCGQCHGCKLERSRQWAVRCMHEASMHEDNSFITLTYDDEHVPERGLQHQDFVKFIKRFRKKHTASYYVAGEYGETNPETGIIDGGLYRPHFHAGLFGHDWKDKKFLKHTPSGEAIYTSETLSKLWGMGFASTAAVSFESMAYIARYCLKKMTGNKAEEHYKRYDYLGEYDLKPEYAKMSLNPAIGKRWLDKYEKDVYPHDYVIVNGHMTRPPKYYDKQFEAKNEKEFRYLKDERAQYAYERRIDNTPQRLLDKEKVAKAKTQSLKRGKV